MTVIGRRTLCFNVIVGCSKISWKTLSMPTVSISYLILSLLSYLLSCYNASLDLSFYSEGFHAQILSPSYILEPWSFIKLFV